MSYRTEHGLRLLGLTGRRRINAIELVHINRNARQVNIKGTAMPQASEYGYVSALGFHQLSRYYDAMLGTITRERRFKPALIKQACFEPDAVNFTKAERNNR